MTTQNTPTPPTRWCDNPQKHRGFATDASTDATDTPTTDTGGPLLTGAVGGAPTDPSREDHPMTTPSVDDIRQAVALSCAMRGCTCEPDIDIDIDHHDGGANVRIAHDRGCPATTTPDWN